MQYENGLDPNHITTGEINKITKKTSNSIVVDIIHTMIWALLSGAMVMFTLFGIAYYDYLINYKVIISIAFSCLSFIFFIFNLITTVYRVRKLAK